jgi:hypothetical protein
MSKLRQAKKVWATFHDKDPRRLIEVNANPWPKSWGLSGEARRVYYLSDKWHQDGKWTAYYHDHEGGVRLWEPWGAQDWLGRRTPAPARGVPFANGAVLGYCLGWVLRRDKDDVEVEAEFREREVMLCAAPSGRSLFALAVKDKEVLALFEGGRLDVRAEGIVG